MYESRFGLTGPPFQLNPDPTFYFGSRGHSNALAYLKFGAHQGEGFIVVTGEVGAGKTTLVRALLGGLDPTKVVAAQVLNTQLQSGELLQSILAAFGVMPQGSSKATHIATLEGFLTALAAKGRRALLVVDEAQNLNQEAIEELRMLSNFQLGNHALLQSFLVGQPELRAQLESPAMEQLRQRVIASCHLGPLDAAETRAYIEHRLRHVGWSELPRFLEGSFERIHAWTGGIPRRINLLCNRLLLSVFLNGVEDIDAELVDSTAGDLNHETSSKRGPRPSESPPAQAAAVPAEASRQPAGLEAVVRVGSFEGAGPGGSILCIAAEPRAWMQLEVLGRAMAAHGGLPRIVLVNPGPRAAVEDAVSKALPGPSSLAQVHLGVACESVADAHATVALRWCALVDELKPLAVMPVGNGHMVLECSLLARQADMPLLRLGAGEGRADSNRIAAVNGSLLDRIADVLYTRSPQMHYALQAEGLPAERMVPVGALAMDVMNMLSPPNSRGSQELLTHTVPLAWQRLAAQGHAVVTAQLQDDDFADQHCESLVAALRAAGSELPMVWPVEDSTAAVLVKTGATAALALGSVCTVPALDYVQFVKLLRGARMVVAGPARTGLDEAIGLGLPAICILPPGQGAPDTQEDAVRTVACDAAALTQLVGNAVRENSPRVQAAQSSAGHGIAAHLARWNERRGDCGAATVSLSAVPSAAPGAAPGTQPMLTEAHASGADATGWQSTQAADKSPPRAPKPLARAR